MNSKLRIAVTIATCILLMAAIPLTAQSKKSKSEAKPTQSTQPPAVKIDLNTASQKDLEALPGVGTATAKKIIAGRPYANIADLKKAGVGQSTIDKIQGQVTVSASTASAPTTTAKTKSEEKQKPSAAVPGGKVDLNTASQTDLEALPGVGTATAKKIIAGRPFASVADLKKAGIPQRTIDKIQDQVTISAAKPATSSGVATASTKPSATSSEKPTRSEKVSQASGTAPVAQSASSGSSAATPAGGGSASKSQSAPAAGSGQVWVNLDTKIYHKEGDRWYGKTKHGKYMSEQDAIAAGYRAAKR
jgi:DNA uptake protein ComE-like DNA-binding protein